MNKGLIYIIAIIVMFVVGIGLIIINLSTEYKLERVQKNFSQDSKIWKLNSSQFLSKDTVSGTIYYIECSNVFNSNITNIQILK